MYRVNEIKHVHLEISSKCNASCPLCPRNFYGYPFNDGYVEHNMTLEESKKIFDPEFVKQLNEIFINGNFGDAVMNPYTVDIIEYFRQQSPTVEIRMSTNGGAGGEKFWKDLARLNVKVLFCIDGLEDTHSIYRRNTLYSTVIKNARFFIEAGGNATWKMIKFRHNEHQIEEASRRSESLGFKSFRVLNSGRTHGPIFDNNKNLVGIIGDPEETDFDKLFEIKFTNKISLDDVIYGKEVAPIVCKAKQNKSVYISSTGEVFPCCFLGFSPLTYGNGDYHGAVNSQLRPLISENNALTHSISQCIEWFNSVENSWDIVDFSKGRLIGCNDVCGKSNK